jgi:CRISPR-associated DxTHG motif protein
MSIAVITILGTIGVPREGQERAKYYFSDNLKDDFSLKREKYTNMLPLLIDNFKEEIVSIYTQTSKARQEEVLAYEELVYDIEKNGFFVSEKSQDEEADYGYLLNGINTIMERYDSVIIDMSHGFRHFPILAIINLIIQNIKNPKKVEFILFAKEIVPFKEYEIIDLKEYLELANLSFMLSTFNQNYTVSNNIKFINPFYQELAEELSDFSHHFLSNSLKPLIDGKLIENIINNLENLQDKKSIENFKNYIKEIIYHLEGIRQLKYKNEWIKLYELSKIMDKRGYQLNAITLLFESVGFYCKDRIYEISLTVKDHIDYFEQELLAKREPITKYSLYTLINQSRNIVKLSNIGNKSDEKFKGDYLYNPETINLTRSELNRLRPKPKAKIKEIIDEIEQFVALCDDIGYFQDFIRDIENLRNNLAHGNSSQGIDDVKSSYQKILIQYEIFCIEEDILKRVEK